MQIKRKTYLPLKTAKPLKTNTQKGLLKISKGALKRVTIKRVSKNFDDALKTGFSGEEIHAAHIMKTILISDEKTSYADLITRTLSMLKSKRASFNPSIFNYNSLTQLYKKLVRLKAISEQKQIPLKLN